MPQIARSFQWYFDGLLCGPGSLDTPVNGQPTIGRPFYGQAKSQLRLTCAFHAECAHEGSEGSEGSACLWQAGSKGCGLPLRAMLIKSALRDWLSVSYGKISITSISHLRWLSPLWCLTAPPSPPAMRWDNKDPQSNPFISRTTISTGYFAPACGGSPAKRARGNAFPRPPGRLYGFSRQRRYKKWRRKRRTSPAQRYYITPEGESPEPACKAKPITGRTLAAQGRKARRLAQPSRP